MKTKETSKKTLRLRLAIGASLTAMMAFNPATVMAQEAAEEVEDAESVLGTVTVTASKRETTLQDLPVSVGVTTGEVIEQAQIRDILDLQTIAPSLRVSQNQTSTNATFIIRGFGNGANNICLLYTSPSPRDRTRSRMPSSA